MKWTDENEAQVAAMIANGLSRSQIAERFGVTRNAICGLAHRLSKRACSSTVEPAAHNGSDAGSNPAGHTTMLLLSPPRPRAMRAPLVTPDVIYLPGPVVMPQSEIRPFVMPPGSGRAWADAFHDEYDRLWRAYGWRVGEHVVTDGEATFFVNGERRFEDRAVEGSITEVQSQSIRIDSYDGRHMMWFSAPTFHHIVRRSQA